jgi:hypothetical protein
MNYLFSFHRPSSSLRVIAWGFLTLGLAVADHAQAQNSSELTATYGRGVHAYFANQIDLAEQFLSQVIEAGSTDPRVFYFRAMTRMRSGRRDEAEIDMRVGAAFEARDPGNSLAIGKALERVQGPARLLLERIRQQARMDRLQQRQKQTRDRYEQLRLREPDVLRREMPVPLEDLVEPSVKLPGRMGEKPTPEAPMPVVEPSGVKSDPAPAKPVPPSEPAVDDPFGTATPAEDDIFGEPEPPAAESEVPGQPAESIEPTEDDPFSEPKPTEEPNDEDDSFGMAPPSTDRVIESADVAEAAPSANDAELAESDRIESGQLMGLLSRVVVSIFPWRGMELPAIGPTSDAGEIEPAGPEPGPFDEGSAVVPASAEQPVETEDESADPFGESADDSSEQPAGEPADDPFGGEATEEKPEALPEASEEDHAEGGNTETDSDDPFGGF